MNKPAVFTFMEYLENVCPAYGIPTPQLEWLEPKGLSIALVQTDQPTVEKSYINGTKQYRIGFNIIAQGTTKDRLELITFETKLISIFEGMVGLDIGDGLIVRKVETTTPSLEAQSENLIVRYQFSVTINFWS